MELSKEERKTLVELERAKAHRFLAQAEKRGEDAEWDAAVNRYYYACFHMAQALLVSRMLSAKTHAGLLRVLGEHFIQTKQLDVAYGPFLSRMMNLRQKADYNCVFEPTQNDIEMCRTQCPSFIRDAEALIE